jgi:hypothetical protein
MTIQRKQPAEKKLKFFSNSCRLFIILLNIIIFFYFQADARAEPWKNIDRSSHFVVYYQEAPAGYINTLIKKAERYYRNITHYLGFRRFNFWTWDNRCKIYLYPDQDEYLKYTGTFSWSRAHVNVHTREISTYIGQDFFFEVILPHEMGHIIFREMVGFDKRLPLWLDEGVACMQESKSYDRIRIARNLVSLGLHLPLKDLTTIVDYNVTIPVIFYNQSASVIDFLLENFGTRNFVNFCRRLRDEDNWEDALKKVYRFKNLEELEKQWMDYLLE